ncbi:MAG: ribonuclease Z [Candidatus Micrarchaeota archaeon]|nr:ribonuclease Z [Candidatus Micrarchaeota archaeon]
MKLLFFGTAGSVPTKARGMPSIAIYHDGDIFMFDCGEGTQRQMMQHSVSIAKVRAVFLTHIHGDHTIGIAGLVRTLTLTNRTKPLEIFIPEGGEKALETLIGFDKATINYRIIIRKVRSGEIYKGKDFSISAFRLVHTASTYGFVFKENDTVRFIKPKIKNLGLKGETFSTLLKKKHIKINNKIIRLGDVSTKKIGRKIVYATDTRPTKATISAASNADILVHESTYSDKESNLAKERFHSTAIEAADIARKAKAKMLVITHPSARYKDAEVLAKEARKVFRNTQIAKDGMVINL